ncbi:MAG: hypothetical protein WCB58_08085 [Acidobacteriaceae bacterium]|jgi:hypothetical protein
MEDQVRQDRDQAATPAGLPLESEAHLSPQIEKFSATELTNLRNELLRGQLDSWQAADLAANFLAGHGYGASAENLRQAITGLEVSRCSIDCLQAALEGVAYIQ